MKQSSKDILAYKHFPADEKLLLMIINEAETNIPPFKEPCKDTSQELGDKIGKTRTAIQYLLFALIEKGLIESKVESRIRITMLTNLTKKLIKNG